MEHIRQTLGGFRQHIPDLKIYKEDPELSPEESRIKTLILLGVSDINHTFDAIKRIKGFESTLAAFKAIANGKASYSLLMVYGGVGNGKTLCCEATVIEMFDRGIYVKRDRWSDIVRALKSHFNGRGTMSYEEYFHNLRSRTRLILDDVGSGSTLGSWEWGELEDIVDYRYERKLFTIITSNLDIKSFPERILSRFRDKSRARLILNEAVDQRPFQEAK